MDSLTGVARITVFTWSRALGDTLLLTPLLRCLRQTLPSARLRLVGAPEVGAFLCEAGVVDEVTDNGDPALAPLATGTVSDHQRALVTARLGNPDLVLGLATSGHELSDALETLGIRGAILPATPPPKTHAAEHALSLAKMIGIEAEWNGPGAVKPFSSRGPVAHAAPVLLHPGSGSDVKCAPASIFEEIYTALRDADVSVSILQGPADERSVRALGFRAPVITPSTVTELAAVIRSSRGLIGNDSGVSHFSGLLGATTIAMFGPTDPHTWSPLGPNAHVHHYWNGEAGWSMSRESLRERAGEVVRQVLSTPAFDGGSHEDPHP